jgi:hypothetical protein
MNETLPHTELPACAAHGDLIRTIDLAREMAELRHGQGIELAVLEPVERDGQLNMRAYWRRKPQELAAAA